MRILFWNLNKRELSRVTAQCAIERGADIVCLAECERLSVGNLANHLGDAYHREPIASRASHIEVFAKNDVIHRVCNSYSRYVMCGFEYHGKPLNIVALHLSGILHDADAIKRCDQATDIMETLTEFEEEYKNDRSIIIGDFNTGPLDKPLVLPKCFNATLFEDVIAKNDSRCFNQKEYKLTYNPTLRFIGESPKNYGSFYYTSNPVMPHWNCLDQCVVRKPLVRCITDYEYLRVIGQRQLVKSAGPAGGYSDHLPLLVSFDLDGRYE